ncbi:protein adenylyltransferase SelO [Sphingopyxis yananensis]|uniref:protein adenylyltransferase SelO n=1 Tax=Sphingopyxis yananensis TaxID=2886687 RepID=UPI001D0F9F74|nr:YdiU family protein [Sphingopyxis yananensis]MCC2603463.1 YdiU family protein [Sphingopyxis yananensis]
MRFPFDNSFFKEMQGFYAPAVAEIAPNPQILAFNDALAQQLGLEGPHDDASAAQWARWLSGAEAVEGSDPLAFAYAGHQFGHFSPQLGDGRAILLGEVLAPNGSRWDVQLKGAGRTEFSRSGDGKAAIGPVLREYLVSEAMAAMGIATTRALAVVATGGRVQREKAHPGAVLTRVAASHIRIGTFQYFAAHHGEPYVSQLAHYSIKRHYPDLATTANPPLALLERVIERQAQLVADWMAVGFVHGVMNTDNVAISGETIDYGPCAFVDHFKAGAVFSSIDRHGRYAYGRQPQILHWNMARLAEALLPAIHSVNPDDVETTKALVDTVPSRFRAKWEANLRAKLGLSEAQDHDRELFDGLFEVMEAQGADFTGLFRALAQLLRGDVDALVPFGGDAWDIWRYQWSARLQSECGAVDLAVRADAMDRVNPLYIPRNHLVEGALEQAEAGDLHQWQKLLAIVQNPYRLQADAEGYDQPAPAENPPYRTFCGT